MLNSTHLRSAAAVIAFSLAIPAFAQRSLGLPQQGIPSGGPSQGVTEIKPMGTIQIGPAVVDNTDNYFPQVDLSARQKPVFPENPRPPMPPFSTIDKGITYNGSTTTRPSTADDRSRFPGINFTGSLPPDPDIAVGPDHVVQVVNGAVAFFDKATGATVFQQADSPSGFWSGTGAPNFIFDPKAFFDQESGRFFIVELALDQTNLISRVLIAVSDDADPRGTWFKYNIDSKLIVDSNQYWLDYPGFGFNKDGVVFSGNMFALPGSSGFGGTLAVSLPKAPMLTGAAVTGTRFHLPNDFTVQIGKTNDTTSTAVYGVARPLGGGSALTVFAFKDFNTTPVALKSTVSVPSWSQLPGSLQRAPSKDGPNLDIISDRMMSTMARNGRIFTAHTVLATGGGKSMVAWYEIDGLEFAQGLGQPSLVQAGTVNLPGADWAYQPSIGVNAIGDVSLVYTRSSTEIFADVMLSSRKAADPDGETSAPVLLFASTRNNTINAFRWGDYSDVEVDPVDGIGYWGTNEIINGSGTWGTVIETWNLGNDGGGGGGGGGNNVAAPPTVSVLLGTLLSGNASSVEFKDRSYYEVTSSFVEGAGTYAGVILDFALPAAKESVRSFSIDVTALRRSGRRVTGMFFLWNYRTNRWEYFSAKPLGTRDGGDYVVGVTQQQFSDFASSGGAVRLLVRSHESINRFRGEPRSHDLRVDFGQLTIVPR